MKKLLYALLAMTLMFGLAACGQEADTDNTDSSNPSETLPSAEATQEQITEDSPRKSQRCAVGCS